MTAVCFSDLRGARDDEWSVELGVLTGGPEEGAGGGGLWTSQSGR